MPTGGQKQTRKMIKAERARKAQTRNELRAKRTDKEQLALLDSKGLVATRERERLEKRINDTT